MAKYRNLSEFITSKIPACIAEVTGNETLLFKSRKLAEEYLKSKYTTCWVERCFTMSSIDTGDNELKYVDFSEPLLGECAAYYLNLPEAKHSVIIGWWDDEEDDYYVIIGDDEPRHIATNSIDARRIAAELQYDEDEHTVWLAQASTGKCIEFDGCEYDA